MDRSSPEAPERAAQTLNARLSRESADKARLVVYIAAAPGAGKTRRLLTDARRLLSVGKRVSIGWIETKGHADLERLSDSIPRIAPRFDFPTTVAAKPDVVLLDELAHGNPGDARNAARWRDALALRDAGISVIGAFDIAQLETVSENAEQLTGQAVPDRVPLSFLQAADEVIALDASPELLRERDPENTTLDGKALEQLRELLLRTIDDLTIATVSPASASTAVAIVPPSIDSAMFLERSVPLAAAMDLLLDVLPAPDIPSADIEALARAHHAELLPAQDPQKIDFRDLRASMVAVPNGKLAAKLVNTKVERDIFVVDSTQSYLERSAFTTPLSATLGDRLRVGYGKLTVYLGAAAGAGKTIAMLDRGAQLKAEGVDVVIGFVESHGREETAAMVDAIETVPRRTSSANGASYSEMDRQAVLARKPRVALVDELAHTNAPGSPAPKRYLDVLAFLRAGIDVITTLNVQHLEALGDVVHRLTGATMRETLPDGILPLADEVLLVDVSPETMRDRLLSGKIYPPERIDAAAATFFRIETLAALRELALREALRAETRERIAAPFDRLLISVVARPDDLLLLKKAARLAQRMEVEFAIAHIAERKDRVDPAVFAEFQRVAQALGADLFDERVDDAALRLIEIARKRAETTVAVGGTLRTPRWPARNAFARRLLDAGARELIVLARPSPTSAPFDDEDA